jgi:hypothetical protein
MNFICLPSNLQWCRVNNKVKAAHSKCKFHKWFGSKSTIVQCYSFETFLPENSLCQTQCAAILGSCKYL